VEKTVEKTAEEIIIGLIQVNPKVTIKEMTKATGLTRRGVEYNLSKLKDNGSIERKGPDKGGFWEIKS
jgi:ATP-dependent DNA helicase RecG